MPYLFTINYNAIHEEIAIWRASHRGMTPFIIMNSETVKMMEADARKATAANAIIGKQTYDQKGVIMLLFGCDVAICENLSFGEFKVR